jgi:ArsR family transcriptional regulator
MSTSPPRIPRATRQAASLLSSQSEKAAAAAALLKSMAHADRLLLLCALVEGEQTVSSLGERSGLQQPSLSQQLAVLRREGLVSTRRDGKFIHYQIASPAVLALLTTLYQQFCA